MMSVEEFEEEFAAELTSHGFVLRDVVRADGEGVYENYKTGERTVWKGRDPLADRQIRPSLAPVAQPAVDLAALERRWDGAAPADPLHPYLLRKGVEAFGIRQRAGKLLIPVRLVDGTFRGLQCIHADGEKPFYRGTQTRGGMHVIGEWGEPVLIAEDYVTAVRWFMAFGCCTLVAFDKGNMLHVGHAIRAAYPYTSLFFVAETQTDVEIADLTNAVKALEGTVLTDIHHVRGVSHG
jgi:putative DNA primase/helicase